MKSNNGRLIGSIIIMFLIIVGGGLYFARNDNQFGSLFEHNKPAAEEPEAENEDLNNIVYLSFAEFMTKYESGEQFVIAFTQKGCPHCTKYLPVYNRVLKDINHQGYVLDLVTITAEAERTKFKELFAIEATPTTLFINQKQVISELVGNREFDELRIWLLAYWEQ